MSDPIISIKKYISFVPHPDDEYRFSYRVSFICNVVMEVGGLLLSYNDHPVGADSDHEHSVVIDARYTFCFQPGCSEFATREFRIIKLYDKRGKEEYMSEDRDYRFRFCDKHAKYRGDCGLLDSDVNLVEVAFDSDANSPVLNPLE